MQQPSQSLDLAYLSARYDFHQALSLEGVIADVEKVLRTVAETKVRLHS
jgi:hypothetical protein